MPRYLQEMNGEFNFTYDMIEGHIIDYQDLLEKKSLHNYSKLEITQIWFQKYNMTKDLITNGKLIKQFYINCIGIDFEYYHANYSISYNIDNTKSIV